MTDRGFSMQGLLDENSALRDENRRLINELTDSYTANAKANYWIPSSRKAIYCNQRLKNVLINLMKLTN